MIILNSKDIEEINNSLSLERHFLNNKNFIISGAFGFIGKYILECLLDYKNKNDYNFNIYAIDNFITSDPSNKDYFETKGVNCINHDINNKLNLDINFDYIVCLAGIASPYYYRKFPFETLNASIDGLKNMFNLKHNKDTKFTYFSSSEV